MPATKAPTVSIYALPDVTTVPELAAATRCDERTLRADLNAGRVPGAFRLGRSWRIVTRTYLDAITEAQR